MEHMDKAMLLLDHHVKNAHKDSQIHAASNLVIPETKQHLHVDHKFAHSEVMARTDSILMQESPAEAMTVVKKRDPRIDQKTSISKQKIVLFNIFDVNGNNEFKYYKWGREYKCFECSTPGFINNQRFLRHVYSKHLREIHLGTNNALKKPHVKRIIPQSEKFGKFKCDNCEQRFRKNQDLKTHQNKSKCKKENEEPAKKSQGQDPSLDQKLQAPLLPSWIPTSTSEDSHSGQNSPSEEMMNNANLLLDLGRQKSKRGKQMSKIFN